MNHISSFVIQSKWTGETHEVAGSDIHAAINYIKNYLVGDTSDYVIHVTGIDAKKAREVKRYRKQAEKQYRDDIEEAKANHWL